MKNGREGKAPAFQFYPADFLSDENVAVMSLAEVGAYVKLMCYEWREGSIPADPGRLARMLGMARPDFEAMWEVIGPCFQPHPTEQDRLVHPRLEKEREKQRAWREKSRLGGKRSARVRAAKKRGIQADIGASDAVSEPRAALDVGKGGSTTVGSTVAPPLNHRTNQTPTLQFASADEASLPPDVSRPSEASQPAKVAQPSSSVSSLRSETGPAARRSFPQNVEKSGPPPFVDEPPPATPEDVRRVVGRIMPLIRHYFYVPDGKPPPRYSDDQDANITKTLLEHGVEPADISAFIVGLAWLRDHGGLEYFGPGDKLTMAVGYKRGKSVVPVWRQATEAFTRHVLPELHRRQRNGPGNIRIRIEAPPGRAPP